MYWVKTPRLIKKVFPQLLWEMPDTNNTLYLTFDDGPHPEQTPFVLEQLKRYNAKGTFFCLGKNIERYPEVYEQIKAQGHSIGNHSYNHPNGWKTEDEEYFSNIKQCQPLTRTKLFRPPYGRISPSQINYLKKKFKIVMWDVLSGDFDPKLQPEDCARNVTDNALPGSIIVFHDSMKAKYNLSYALPEVLQHFSTKGVTFAALPTEAI